MPVVDHLEELRRRIIYVLIGIITGIILSLVFIKYIIIFLKAPIADSGIKLYYFKPYEKITAYLKISFFLGLIINIPFLLYHLTAFILPALYKNERKFYFLLIVFTGILFVIGAYFCYKIIAPISFKFLINFMSDDEVLPLWSIKDYFDMLMLFIFLTGIVFQMPLIMVLLARLGVVSGKFLAKYRRHAILAIFIIAAIVTPPDVVSQILVAIPMILLYEISIILARITSKRMEKRILQEENEEIFNRKSGSKPGYNPYENNPYDKSRM